MKKVFAVLLAVALCLSFCACAKEKIVTDESTVTTTEAVVDDTTEAVVDDTTEAVVDDTTEAVQDVASNEDSEDVLAKAAAAYAEYFSQYSGDDNIVKALVVDLDKNKIPEVIYTYYGDHNMYIVSYSETDGIKEISPELHSSTPAEVYFSEETGILYYTDSGHNYGTASYHEGVCLKATSNGFKIVGTASGDEWEDLSEEDWNNYELLDEIDAKYDKIFDEKMAALTGEGPFVSFFDVCEEENAKEYLTQELSKYFGR